MPRRIVVALLVVILGTATGCVFEGTWVCLWPPIAALLVILATRHALFGLLAGGLAGAVLLTGGNPVAAAWSIVADHLAPSLRSSWKQGAIVFTLVLGGFAAVLEAGGGFRTLLLRIAQARARSGAPDGNGRGGLGSAVLL